jgi:hypothetical protein
MSIWHGQNCSLVVFTRCYDVGIRWISRCSAAARGRLLRSVVEHVAYQDIYGDTGSLAIGGAIASWQF